VTAYKLIHKYKNIESITEFISKEKTVLFIYRWAKKCKYVVPEDFNYLDIRKIFKSPEMLKSEEIKVVKMLIYF
jgi:hypothetical protein